MSLESQRLRYGKYSLWFSDDKIYLSDGETTNYLDVSNLSIIEWTPDTEGTYPAIPGGTEVTTLNHLLTTIITTLRKHEHKTDDIENLQQWFEEKKPELKGEKGDKGDKGDKGATGERGPRGYQGEKGEKGEDCENNGWIWDLVNTGLTAASYTALQAQVASLASAVAALQTVDTAGDTLDLAGDTLDQLQDVKQDIDTSTRWGKVAKWFSDLWDGLGNVKNQYNAVETVVNDSLEASTEFIDDFGIEAGLLELGISESDLNEDGYPILSREVEPDIKTDFQAWIGYTFPNLKTIIYTCDNLMRQAGYDVRTDTKSSFWKMTYMMVGELSDRIDLATYDDSDIRNITNLMEKIVEIEQIPHTEMHGGIPVTVYEEIEHPALRFKAKRLLLSYNNEDKFVSLDGHKHYMTDILDYIPYDDTELRTLINSSVSDINTTLTQKADLVHTHTTEDILDYEPYDDTEIRAMINNKVGSVHTHTLSDITDYTPYDDSELKTLINTKANSTHTHSISDVNDLQSTLNGKADKVHTHAISDITDLQTTINSKLNTSEFNKLNSVIKTYRIRNDWRAHNVHNPIAYVNIGYVKNNFTAYKGFMAKFELNIAASNNSEATVFESSVVCIGHVMEYPLSTNPKIGISSCYQIIGDKNRKLGIGLVDINGDNTVYGIEVLASGYNGYYRANLNITCEMDTKIKLYTDTACTTEKDISTTIGNMAKLDDYTKYQSYALADYPYALKEHNHDNVYSKLGHTHAISDITDYTAYDDTELRTKLNACETEMAKEAELITNNTNRIKDLETGIVDFGVEVVNHSQILNSLTSTIVNLVYPVGSIYMTTNNNIMDPADIFPNTKWSPLSGAFLLPDMKAELKGGSKKITVDNLPPHYHKYKIIEPYDRNGYPDGSDDTSNGYAANESYWRGNKEATATFNGSTDTGNGTDYMPPYYTVKAWKRIE